MTGPKRMIKTWRNVTYLDERDPKSGSQSNLRGAFHVLSPRTGAFFIHLPVLFLCSMDFKTAQRVSFIIVPPN